MSNHIENDVLLEVKEIVKKFGNALVLGGDSLEIKKGEVCAILGPSGCGKSTFLRCINGLENINEGKIIFKQKDIYQNKTDWRNIRQKIGMVFQNYELFPHLSVLENIILDPTKVQKRREDEVISQDIKLVNRVGLENKKDDYPKELRGGHGKPDLNRTRSKDQGRGFCPERRRKRRYVRRPGDGSGVRPLCRGSV